MADITVPGMFLTGTHAARPAAGTVGRGTLYACSDHTKVYQTTDGSNWVDWYTANGVVSYASNSNAVASASAPGASSLVSRADHVHLGVASLAVSSNTLSGPVTLTAEGPIGLTVAGSTVKVNSVAGSSGSGSALAVKDEGSNLDTAVTSLDFVGAGVTATAVGHAVTVTVAGGGGSGVGDKLYLYATQR